MSRLVTAPAIAVEHGDDGVVYVARVPSGPILILEGAAAIVWDAACGHDETSVAERVAHAVGVETADVADDVRAFLADLLGEGLLVPQDEGVQTAGAACDT